MLIFTILITSQLKVISDCENIHSLNLLHLIISFATGHFKEEHGEKNLILDSTKKYEEVFSGIRSEIKTINDGNKHLKFPTLTIIIKCVLQNDETLYPQIYLDECLYEL